MWVEKQETRKFSIYVENFRVSWLRATRKDGYECLTQHTIWRESCSRSVGTLEQVIMQITCTICSDLLVPADTVVGSNCGHVFHHQCLIQWLERSKSCPQCRAKVNDQNIFRIYFNIHTLPVEDATMLQHKVDSMNFQLLLKDTELKKCHEEIASHKTKTDGLRNEIKRLKGCVKNAETTNTILKEQFSVLKERNDDLEPIMRECESLRKELKFLRNIETIVKGTADEVEEMLYDYGGSSDSTKSLLTFTSVLKKEMQAVTAKKREIGSKLRETESKVSSLSSKVRTLQNDLVAQQEENTYLLQELNYAAEEHSSMKQKLQALEQAMVSPGASHPCASALKRLLAESPAPATIIRAYHEDSSGEGPISPPALASKEKKKSPYLNIKSSSIGLTPLRPNQSNNTKINKYSIFGKRRINLLARSSESFVEEEYDGMGGHSKRELFPSPIPRMKIKKIDKHQRLSKIKLKDVTNSLKMDHFLKK